MSLEHKIRYGWFAIVLLLLISTEYSMYHFTGSDIITAFAVLIVGLLLMIPTILIAEELRDTKIAKRRFIRKNCKKYHVMPGQISIAGDVMSIKYPKSHQVYRKNIYTNETEVDHK